MKTSLKMLAVAAAAAMSFGAQAIVIDDFSVGQGLIVDNNVNASGAFSSVAGPAANILGGWRDLFVIETASNPDNPSTGVSLDVFGGELGFSNGTGQAGVGIVRWDGANANFGAVGADAEATLLNAIHSIDGGGLGSVDLSGAGIGFVIDVVSADLGFNFQLEAYSGAGNRSVFTTAALGPGNFFIPFGAFVPVSGTGADFASIGALQAIINYPGQARVDVDLRVRIAEAVVSAPGTLALTGLALAGLGLVARRRKTA